MCCGLSVSCNTKYTVWLPWEKPPELVSVSAAGYRSSWLIGWQVHSLAHSFAAEYLMFIVCVYNCMYGCTFVSIIIICIHVCEHLNFHYLWNIYAYIYIKCICGCVYIFVCSYLYMYAVHVCVHVHIPVVIYNGIMAFGCYSVTGNQLNLIDGHLGFHWDEISSFSTEPDELMTFGLFFPFSISWPSAWSTYSLSCDFHFLSQVPFSLKSFSARSMSSTLFL